MKFYLWWWWVSANWDAAYESIKSCIKEILERESTKQLLHFPFARTWLRKHAADLFAPKNMKPFIESLWVEYLDASYYEDIEKFNGDTVYMNWWNDTNYLMKMCSLPILHEVLKKTRIIAGESAWPMIFGKYFRSSDDDGMKEWFWYVTNTIIEPHYTEREREVSLASDLGNYPWTVWLWIDEETFVEYENGTYWEIIWKWWVFHV